MARGAAARRSLPRWCCRLLGTALFASVAVLAGSHLSTRGPPSELRLPPDRVYASQESPAAVVFSHASHVAYSDNHCLACHPQPFSILGRHVPLLHEEMDAGGSCGVCHNGRDATDVVDGDSCDTCHTGVQPRSVRLARSADSLGPVTFRHSAHPQACPTCHPQPFAMQVRATPLRKDEMFEGATCGRCHDGNTAFGVDDGDRCETCHDSGG